MDDQYKRAKKIEQSHLAEFQKNLESQEIHWEKIKRLRGEEKKQLRVIRAAREVIEEYKRIKKDGITME